MSDIRKCDWCGKESEVLYTCAGCGDENCPKCHIDIAGTCWDCATDEGDDDWLKDEGVSKPPKKEVEAVKMVVCEECGKKVKDYLTAFKISMDKSEPNKHVCCACA